jgi:hypothetical protein
MKTAKPMAPRRLVGITYAAGETVIVARDGDLLWQSLA